MSVVRMFRSDIDGDNVGDLHIMEIEVSGKIEVYYCSLWNSYSLFPQIVYLFYSLILSANEKLVLVYRMFTDSGFISSKPFVYM